ncbi:hypothetical protein [Acinetobacter indicus]|uniref:hypothetical protein n=1 Tax=Acinetobacter indicus TaxID=756892 RepID=UPI000FD94F8F|nr:hypothetical protein [Acinetobacter indicus]RVT29901.1 hypothetical protein ENC20_15225 [Acinetobacter indicus]UNW05614.1 hypothetical protein MOW12_07310 [Acinetobacter indicus]
MEGQLVDFHGSVFLSLLGLSLIILIYIYILNLLFIKKNSKELSERIYGIEEYLDDVGISFEKIMQLNFIFSLMWFSYFVTYKRYKKMPYFAKRGEKSPSLYPNLYQDNVIYLCEKFKYQIIKNEVLSLVFLLFAVLSFLYEYVADFIINLGF